MASVEALTGSVAFVLQGLDMEVHDLDIQTDEREAYRKMGRLHKAHLIEDFLRTRA